MEFGTCQICSRQIRSKNGLIAHHGFRRPGEGYQTTSCFGARRLPYEVSRDAISEFIGMTNLVMEHNIDILNEFVSNPPETLIDYEYNFKTGKCDKVVEYNRPKNFEVQNDVDRFYVEKYQSIFDLRVYKMCQAINSDIKLIKDLEKRYDNWKGE